MSADDYIAPGGIEDFLAPGVCLHCGHQRITWSPQAIVEAAQRDARRLGRPPKGSEWRAAAPDHPSVSTVLEMFAERRGARNGWNRMLMAAGLEVRTRRGSGRWSKDEIANAMLTWVLRHGAWPTTRGWEGADRGREFPAPSTVIRVFGTWNAGKRYAGWNGQRKPEPYVEPLCTGCGAELENNVEGCTVCHDRHRNRARRQAETAAVSTKSKATVSDQKEGSYARAA